MIVTIEIDCNNAAFEDHPERELSAILDNLMFDIGEYRVSLKEENSKFLYDSNGNKVGYIKVVDGFIKVVD